MVSRANKETIVVDTVTLDEVCTDKEEFTSYYSFKSKHSVEVISDSLRSIFPPDGATNTTLVLRDELGSKTCGDHLCTLRVQTMEKNFCWPTMEANHVDILREIRRLR